LIATPAVIKSKKSLSPGVGGQYEPLNPIKSKSTIELLSHASQDVKMLNKQVERSLNQTKDYFNWLKSKPIIAPMHGLLSLASGFGARIDPFRFTPSFHSGLDFSSNFGAPFYATAKGKVIEASWHEGYGNQILIDHGDGYRTRYAHASRIYVKPGMVVEQNALLGSVGNTGRSTGPHLHYEVIRSGERMDPVKMLLK
jgi:murein DD-endopeptidase MepM/ murein hydrolase activator NlpD